MRVAARHTWLVASGVGLLLLWTGSRCGCQAEGTHQQQAPAAASHGAAPCLEAEQPRAAQLHAQSPGRLEYEATELARDTAGPGAAPGSDPVQRSRLRFRGESRIRWKSVRTSQPLARGPYGEMLHEGSTLTRRLVLEVEARIAQGLSTGGKIRVSDEGRDAFENGPEYLSNERGSAFIRYDTGNVRSTFGYYDVYFTPLTLMRWDAEDAPQSGGESGCACSGAAGAVTAESLDELAPDLVFEGLKVNTTVAGRVDVTALFARPRSAEEGRFYLQHAYGARAKWVGYHPASSSFRWLGTTYVTSRDDERSVAYAPYVAGSSEALSVDFRLPLHRNVALSGEWALTESPLSRTHRLDQGQGMVWTMEWTWPARAVARLSYLRMTPEFGSLYDALSYSANRQGFRFSSDCEIWRDRLSAWGFFKRLRELESTAPSKASGLLTSSATLGLGISIRPSKQRTARVGYILKAENLDDQGSSQGPAGIENDTHIFTTQFVQSFARGTGLTFACQWIDHRDEGTPALDYHARLLSALFSARF